MRAATVLLATCLLFMDYAWGMYTMIEGHGMYRLGQSSVTLNAWSLAYQTCSQEGGNLAVIDSTEEANALKPLLADSTTQFIYIGFSDLIEEGNYLTVFGKPIDETGYIKWYNGAPNGGTSTNCGAVTRDMEIADQGCSNRYDYICEIPLWYLYSYVKDVGYYKFYTDGQTWKDAVRTCESDGAQLLLVDSENEYKEMMLLFEEHPHLPNTDDSDYIYYGIHDYYTNGITVTIQGEVILESDMDRPHWDRNEPKEDLKNNVARMDRYGLLSMVEGTDRYAFICEHNMRSNVSYYVSKFLE